MSTSSHADARVGCGRPPGREEPARKGADPKVHSSEHRVTALLFAAYFGHVDVVKTLIAKGARVDLKDWGGAGAIDWAAVGGHDEIVRLVAAERAVLNPFLAVGSMPLWLMDLAAGRRK